MFWKEAVLHFVFKERRKHIVSLSGNFSSPVVNRAGTDCEEVIRVSDFEPGDLGSCRRSPILQVILQLPQNMKGFIGQNQHFQLNNLEN